MVKTAIKTRIFLIGTNILIQTTSLVMISTLSKFVWQEETIKPRVFKINVSFLNCIHFVIYNTYFYPEM